MSASNAISIEDWTFGMAWLGWAIAGLRHLPMEDRTPDRVLNFLQDEMERQRGDTGRWSDAEAEVVRQMHQVLTRNVRGLGWG